MFRLQLVVLVAATAAFAYQFDPTVSRRAVWLQKASDCHHTLIANWTCAPCNMSTGISNISVFDNATHGAQGYVAFEAQRNEIIVAFRGSHNLINWIEDFDFKFQVYPYCANVTAKPIPMPPRSGPPMTPAQSPSTAQLNRLLKHVKGSSKIQGAMDDGPSFANHHLCYIHAGFFAVYNDISVEIVAAVKALLAQNPTATVLVTGHSLGAAMATHAALDLVWNLPKSRTLPDGTKVSPVTNLVTMGSPRVGNPVFAKWAAGLLAANNVSSTRMVHNSDLVPKLPAFEMGYMHIPHEVWFPYGHSNTSNPDEKVYKVCDDSATHEDPECSDSVLVQDVVLLDHMQIMGIELGC